MLAEATYNEKQYMAKIKASLLDTVFLVISWYDIHFFRMTFTLQ